MKKVTRKQAQKWIEESRPDLGLHETVHGHKGFYIKRAGPAATFTNCHTWRGTLAQLQGVLPNEVKV